MTERTWFGVAKSAVACAAIASPAFLSAFNSTYKVKATSSLGKAESAVCHAKGKQPDPYGEDLGKALGGAKKLAPEILAKVEALDSDKDGEKNIDGIRKGALPGDAQSR